LKEPSFSEEWKVMPFDRLSDESKENDGKLFGN